MTIRAATSRVWRSSWQQSMVAIGSRHAATSARSATSAPVPLAFAALVVCAAATRFPPRRAWFAVGSPEASVMTSAWSKT